MNIFSFSSFLIIGLIIYFISRARKRGKKEGIKGEDWYLQLFLSKEDAISQFFFLFSVFFLGEALFIFNKYLGEPLSWRPILLLVSIIGIIIAYYFKVVYTLAVSLIGFMVWWSAQAKEWAEARDIKDTALLVSSLLIATIFYLLGRVHEKKGKLKRVAMVYLLLGLIPITSVLFFLSTKSGLETLEQITKGVIFLGSWKITLSFYIIIIFLIGILFYALNRNLIFKPEAAAIGFLILIFLIIAFLPEQNIFLNQYGSNNNLSYKGILLAIFFNILIFLELVGIIFLGYLKREDWLINFGVFFIFILIFVKYFDWFFTFLDKSIFFIGAGILLFVVGWFMERGRRYLLSIIKKEESAKVKN